MMHHLGRLAFLAAAPLILSSCFLTPGKFTSKLVINADRSFSFSYQGEVIALDVGDDFTKGLGGDDSKDKGPEDDQSFDPPADDGAEETEAGFIQIGWPDDDKADKGGMVDDDAAKKAEEKDRKLRAVADALRKERGYKSVAYVGQGKFVIDYAISGTLTHNFIYPFNIDAEAVFPFIAVELRGADIVRVKAPGFGKESSGSEAMPGGGGGDSRKAIDGVFTLETDAEIVSQNNEDGATTGAGGRRTISWTITPLTKDAPTAVLKLGK